MSLIEIPAQPKPARLQWEKTALIIIDMQKDFLLDGGFGAQLGNDVSHLRRAIAPIQRLLAAARRAAMVVIHTREGHEPDMQDCPPTKLDRWPQGTRIGDAGPMGRILIRGEEGHDIVEELEPLPLEHLVDKPGKNAFYDTKLDAILRAHDIRHLLIAGVTTDVCCLATVIAANDHGYHAVVLSDCVASYSPERHAAALAIIQAQGGIFGYVAESSAVVTALASAEK